MKIIKGEYAGNFRCKIHHEFSNSVVLTDVSKDNPGVGFTPPELFAISLVTCVATVMGYEAEALKLDLSGMTMSVDFEMSKDKPRRIIEINTEFWVPCDVTEHQKELLAKVTKNCPVSHSIHPDVKQSIKFHWEAKE